jgi:hypothetical protein
MVERIRVSKYNEIKRTFSLTEYLPAGRQEASDDGSEDFQFK